MRGEGSVSKVHLLVSHTVLVVDVLLLLVVHGLEDVPLVEEVGFCLDLVLIITILRKYDVVQILPRETESLGLLHGDVQEVTVLLVHYVVVADNLYSLLLLADLVVGRAELGGAEGEACPDEPLSNEVHLRHLLLLFVNDPVGSISRIELSGHEANHYFIEEHLVIMHRPCEEPLEAPQNIEENEVSHYVLLNLFRDIIQGEHRVLKHCHSVVLPKEVKVFLDRL
mmetsp:Transcript_18712/g.28684  ORF Transcript_18712/g.28684 Transcript_18712/m.28684 type:complete len:225 (-) Transcript_18712:1622-2296(-)